jgi:hypothetical protein
MFADSHPQPLSSDLICSYLARSPSPPTRVAEFLQASSLRFTDNDPSTASVVFTDSEIKNPFPTSYPLQPPQSQLPELVQHSAFNPFIHPNLSNSNGAKLPPLPPRKPLSSTSNSSNSHAPPPPPRHAASSRIERSISPTMTGSTPPIPPKPSQHVTSTLIKQSLHARKIAQSMKKAEEQLDKERVLQVLKSSSIVTGAYPLAGASVVGSSVVIGTNIHNQHQHQHPNAGSSGAKCPKSLPSSVSSGSEGGRRPQVPPLPKRRSGHPASQQPSPPLSDGSLEQVALASSLPHPEFSNPLDSTNPHSRSSNPFNKDDFPSHPLPAPPPMHPDRNPTFGYHQLNLSPKPPSDLPPQLKTQNIETFEAIYGSMSSQSSSPFRSTSGGGSISTNPHAFPPNSVTADSPTRPFRSQSLSHHSPVSQAPLPPPVRRRRPETIQLLGNAEGTTPLSRRTSLRSSRGVGHRKSSLSLSSASSFRSSSPFTDDNTPHRLNSGASTSSVGGNNSASGVVGSNIQRTIEALHHIHGQLQPKLDKARYKAEAGLSKRGYVRSAMRSSGEESPTAVESSEQEGLTRRCDSRNAKERWLETSGGQAQTEVDEGESGSDESEWERGRATNISRAIRRDDSLSNPSTRIGQ